MQDRELAEIESRVLENLAQARRDVLKLTSEFRSASGITEPVKTLAQHSPLHDALTGLLNGDAYGVQFSAAKARAKRNKKRFAVLSVFLSFSKEKLNPVECNVAVKVAAERLEKCVRTTDTVARIDREEFAILLEDLTGDGQAHLVMQKVQQALSEPIHMGERKIPFDPSVNIQVYPKSRENGQLPPLNS